MSIEIEIADTQAHMKVDQAVLKSLVRDVLIALDHPAASISIALVDSATIHRLNERYLGHDWPTDVITFPLSDALDPALSGELVISTEMAVTVARETGGKPLDELALYVVHGLLHLCGHDDSTEELSAAMHRRQSELLEFVSLSPAGKGPG